MFPLSIVTPEKTFYEEEVSSVIAPGIEGYLGILTDHAPLITALVPGKITVKNSSDAETVMTVSGGFLEVLKNKVVILADSVEFAKDIDLERATKALERARQRIKSKEKDIDIPRATAALKRAQNRIAVCEECIKEKTT
ncbi:MAG: F0F1 ATP synthase subunit epsilon [candidate division Zixibacteria bacterium]|nr:F0F1 ATP synthase subunit epsilon [candidate division Zixibacteria bacterium]